MWSSYTRDKCGPLTPGINVVLSGINVVLLPGINVVLSRDKLTRDKCGPLTPGIYVVLLHQG